MGVTNRSAGALVLVWVRARAYTQQRLFSRARVGGRLAQSRIVQAGATPFRIAMSNPISTPVLLTIVLSPCRPITHPSPISPSPYSLLPSPFSPQFLLLQFLKFFFF